VAEVKEAPELVETGCAEDMTLCERGDKRADVELGREVITETTVPYPGIGSP